MLREGDIDALRRKARLEGKPIKSTLIRGKGKEVFFRKRKDGSSKIDHIRTDDGQKADAPKPAYGEGRGKVDIGERMDHVLKKRKEGYKRKYFHK